MFHLVNSVSCASSYVINPILFFDLNSVNIFFKVFIKCHSTVHIIIKQKKLVADSVGSVEGVHRKLVKLIHQHYESERTDGTFDEEKSERSSTTLFLSSVKQSVTLF